MATQIPLKLAFPLFLLINLSTLVQPGLSQSTPQSIYQPIGATFDPPRDGVPGNTAGGASRSAGQCPQDAARPAASLTPLTPGTDRGLTVSDHPTFLVYLRNTSARQLFFSVKGEDDSYHYQTFLPLTEAQAVTPIQLPPEAAPLEVGKAYRWSAVLVCGATLRPDDPIVDGYVERVALPAAMPNPSQGLLPLEQATQYGSAGIWYDTIAIVADLRTHQPNDVTLQQTWASLLTSVGLDNLLAEPVLP